MPKLAKFRIYDDFDSFEAVAKFRIYDDFDSFEAVFSQKSSILTNTSKK